MYTKQFKWLCTYTNWQNDNEKTEKSWMITKEVKPTKRKDYIKDARLQSRVDHQVWCGDCNTPWQTEKVSWFLAFGFVWLYYYYHYYSRLVISHFFHIPSFSVFVWSQVFVYFLLWFQLCCCTRVLFYLVVRPTVFTQSSYCLD